MNTESEENLLDFSFVLASSVHDMKNSLGMLLNTLNEVIEQSPPQNPVQEKNFSVLQYEAARINSELIQLLALYRMKDQRMMVRIDENYVIDVLEEQLARNEMVFQTRGLLVEVDCDADLKWYFDSELIGGVINNVLVNCARYCRSKLSVRASIEDNQLRIAIADDGGGYPQAMLDAPLQENAGVSFSQGSTNLGLLFAFKVAELHRANGQSGHIHLANGGPLGGGVLMLALP